MVVNDGDDNDGEKDAESQHQSVFLSMPALKRVIFAMVKDDCWLRDPRGLACFSSNEYCRDTCDNEMKLCEMTTMSIHRKIRKYANAYIETWSHFNQRNKHRQLLMLKRFNNRTTTTVNLYINFPSFFNVVRAWMVFSQKLQAYAVSYHNTPFSAVTSEVVASSTHSFVRMAWNCSSSGRECHKYEPQSD